jgi:cytochrome oxidase assembly protein ShyY1
MQYVQRRLHLSVNETRRSVATRPKVSTSTLPPYVAGRPAVSANVSGVPGSHRQGSYGFLLSRRWLGLLALALLAAAACAALGNWQLDRLGNRHERNDLLRRNLGSEPVSPDTLLTVGRPLRPGDEYARVRVTGHYDASNQLLVRLRPFEGAVGYHVLTPFVSDAGPALLVNRGWVPAAGTTGADLPDVPDAPSGEVTITARVRPSEPASTTGTPPPGQVTRIDVPGIAKQLPYDVYGGYGDLTRENPAPRDAPEPVPAPEPSEGPHLAYAFQWFLFGLLALGGLVVLARREAADRLAADEQATGAEPPGDGVGDAGTAQRTGQVRITRSVRG